MPTLLVVGPYRFFFYANEGQEPPHVHVEAGDRHAKYWLMPVRLASNLKFRSHELKEVEALVTSHSERFLESWHAFFKQR